MPDLGDAAETTDRTDFGDPKLNFSHMRTGFLFSHFRTKYWIRTILETARWKRRRATKPLTMRCAFLTSCTALVKARLIGLALTCF